MTGFDRDGLAAFSADERFLRPLTSLSRFLWGVPFAAVSVVGIQ